MFWKLVENHSDLNFISKINEEIISDNNPLFIDEASIQLLKYGRENFKFNEGYNKVHFTCFTAFIKNVYLDPIFFILIKGTNTLIKESIIFNWYQTSFKKFTFVFILRQYKTIDEAIIFDAKVGLNIFHFYNEILPKIFLVRSNFSNLPLLIGKELYESKIFQFYLQFDFVKNNNWKIISKNKYLYVKKMYLIKTPEYDTEKIKLIVNSVLFKTKLCQKNNLKLFINRKKSTGRNIINFDELKPILLKYNFKILYLEDISIEEQIDYFSRAKLIIGIHGAGLTNIIFSYKNDPQIIEITAADFVPTHYYWLSKKLTYKYNLFLGSNMISKEGKTFFSVNINRLSNIISSL